MRETSKVDLEKDMGQVHLSHVSSIYQIMHKIEAKNAPPRSIDPNAVEMQRPGNCPR